MMNFNTLTFEQIDRVGVLTINRPKAMNALNAEVMSELTAFCEQVVDLNVGCIVLTGAGEKAFVAGADIKEMAARLPEDGLQVAQEGQEVFRKIEQLPIPVIVAANGYILGGGLEMALACDYIVMSNTAKFGAPEVALGILPGFGGSQRLLRCVGKSVTSLICLTGDIFTAQQALQWGVAAELVEPDQLMEHCLKQAAVIASRSPNSLRLVKRAIYEGDDLPQREAEDLEARLFAQAFASEHRTEGLNAFIEKRDPKFF
ncbi:enoyl-CoA hydratase/isomerase family protein [Sessilibacter corallicola]|uniref:Enoyl-CoA hydratase-related protein n=1 Tax=Sessilibacter corallicola TaxID=2904075 RepID=A0ABQ0A3S7_9GAMM|nr:enoyl-CoA hydratase-related protein [Sessilibacter corallicola]MCE2027070.1 enoyl-CoA hydratase-related protein [Sessilibacter corallicola]